MANYSSRRTFIQSLVKGGCALGLSTIAAVANAAQITEGLDELNHMSPEDGADQDDIWRKIRGAYTLSDQVIDFNNGGVSPAPLSVQNAHKIYLDRCNKAPSFSMWHRLDQERGPIKEGLAKLLGTNADELAFVRNTTSGLNNIYQGIDWKPGDEIVASIYDYVNVVSGLKQLEKRHGVVVKWVDFGPSGASPRKIVRKYKRAITKRTRLMNITHVINWSGLVLPVKELCALARKNEVFTVVDGAHSFAHLDFKLYDFDCDAYATSLHKWLGAPFGTGLLYVKKDQIPHIHPLMASAPKFANKIVKFEAYGTHSGPAIRAIEAALEFHNAIGSDRKEKRLKYLTDSWIKLVKDVRGVQINTRLKPGAYNGIAHFSIKNQKTADTQRFLKTNGLHVGRVAWGDLDGIRISPNVYTNQEDIEKLCAAIKEAASAT